MIYTLGHRGNYLIGLRDATAGNLFMKQGATPGYYEDGSDYHGGSVWQTPKEVWDYIDGEPRLAEYSVFELDADWDTQTVMALSDRQKGYPFRRLIVDAAILKEILRQ